MAKRNQKLAEFLGGELCIYDTSVPVPRLFQYLINGKSIISFIEENPAVDKETVLLLLKNAESLLVEKLTNLAKEPIIG